MKHFRLFLIPLLSFGLLYGCSSVPHEDPDPAHTLPFDPAKKEATSESNNKTRQLNGDEQGISLDRPSGSASNLDDPNNSANGLNGGSNGDSNATWQNNRGSGYQSYGNASGEQFDANVEPGHRIHFDFNSSLITEEAARTLSHNAQWMRTRIQGTVIVEGHCDERGTREFNLALGQQRADAVRAFLISQGMDASRLKSITYGKERPLDSGHNESAYSKNRRSEIILP